MITIKGFETYQLSATSLNVFSLQEGEWKPLKKECEGAHVYFVLYKNNVRKRVSLWTILRDNWEALSEKITQARQDQ